MADVVTRFVVQSNEYNSKVKTMTQHLLNMERECRKVGGTLAVMEKEQIQAARELGNMETAARDARGRVSELSSAFVNISAQMRRMTEVERNGEFGKALTQSLDRLKIRIKEEQTALKDIQGEMKAATFSGESFKQVVDAIGSKMGINGSLTELVTSRTAIMTTAIGASVAVVGKAAEAWAAYNSELGKQDNITQVTTGLKNEDAERMTDAMRALAATYDVQFRDAVNAANTLMTQFGASGDEAIKLLREGMQGMIQGDGQKLLSMIQQYAPAFRDAGISASQLVAIIHNSEGGIFTDQNMNAIVMGIKNIRIMSKTTSEALAKLGIDGQKMSQMLNDGTINIFEALRMVSQELQKVDSNSQTAGEVMQAVFGKMGTAAGTNLAKAIETLNTNLDQTKTQTGELGEALNKLNTANTHLSEAIRQTFGYKGYEEMATGIKTSLVEAIADAVDALDAMRKMWDSIGSGAKTVLGSIYRGFADLMGPLSGVYKLMYGIAGFMGGGSGTNTGGNRGSGYNDMAASFKYISNGGTEKERQARYDRQLAGLQSKLSNIGKEREVQTATGLTTIVDDAATQERKRKALQTRIAMLQSQRETLITRPAKVETPYIDPNKGTGSTDDKKGGKTTKTKPQLTVEQQTALDVQKAEKGYADALAMAQTKLIENVTTSDEYDKEIQKGQQSLADAYLKAYTATGDEKYLTAYRETADHVKTLQEGIDQHAKAQKEAAEALKRNSLNLGSTGGIASLISTLKSDQAAQTIGSAEWDNTTARLMGAENLQTITSTALASGVDASKVAELTEPLRNALKDNLIDKDGVSKMVTDLVDSMNEQMAESPLKMQVVVDNAGIVQASKNMTTEVEKQREAWKKTGTVIGLVGQAFNAFEDPAAKIMGTVAQAIATVALAYADAMAKDQTQKFNIFGFIAAATAATISMASTIASIHSATGYAQGGIIKGDSYSGDNIPASTFVNAGELVLNRAQQGNLASQLEQGGGAVGGGAPYVTGETIFLGLNNYMRSHGYGELIPSRR